MTVSAITHRRYAMRQEGRFAGHFTHVARGIAMTPNDNVGTSAPEKAASRRSTPPAEKRAQQVAGLVGRDAALDRDAMVVALGNQRVEYAAGGTGLRIGRRIDDARDACVNQCHRAHLSLIHI